MPYKLKPGQESFEIMGGPDEGKQFFRGNGYQTIPAGYEDRFDEITAPAPATKLIPRVLKKKDVPAPEEIRPWDAEEKANDE